MMITLDNDLTSLFALPIIMLDEAMIICDANQPFTALFGAVIGQNLNDLTDDFNQRKCERRSGNGQAYHCRISVADKADLLYRLEIRKQNDHFVAIAFDASESARSDAMLASYSKMMENQLASLQRENKKLSNLLTYYKSL